MKPLSLLAILFISISIRAQLNIIPQPTSIKQPRIAANFSITPATQIVLEGSNMDNTVKFLNGYLEHYYHFKLKVARSTSGNNVIRLNYERVDNPIPGGYLMTVDNKGVYIAGDNETGVFYGVQTLIQLLPSQIPDRIAVGSKAGNYRIQVPYVSIKDDPRFPYRGMHLDVGRHFLSVAFVKKYIDWIALHKMNYFHWHLTEDQGWRIEIKKYPGLTKVGAWRNGTIIGRFPGTGNDGTRYGGYYTQEEIKEVVAYAAERYITVIPEIEMPGHCSAAIAAYPWLSCFPNESTKHPPQCAWSGDSTGKQVQQTWGVFEDVYCAGKDSTFKFLQDVLDEVMKLFPSKYIHVGGDECPKANWKRCPLCQQRIKAEGLKDEHELQSYFIQRMEKYLNSKGRTLIGWDEILEGGLAPNAVVMSWRGEAGGIAAAREKHDVVMTPGAWVYFDHSQSLNEDSVTIGGYTPIEKTYSYEPVSDSLTAEQGKYILGAQGNVWTEYMSNDKKVEYMIFPRMAALSEVLWSQTKNRDSANFEKRLLQQFKRYDLWKVNYSKAYFDLKGTVSPTTDFNGVLWKLESKIPNARIQYRDTGDSDDIGVSDYFDYDKSFKVEKSSRYEARITDSGKQIGNSLFQKFFLNETSGKKITITNPPSQNYPGDGAFTLVNGVQNEKGLLRSREFLGFSGTDCEALIDLGEVIQISNVKAHIFEQTGSRIYRPRLFQVVISADGKIFTEMGVTDVVEFKGGNRNGIMTVQQKSVATRYLKIKLENYGTIPDGNPGAGNKAWLLVDEIEAN